jgi:hypothetical protein
MSAAVELFDPEIAAFMREWLAHWTGFRRIGEEFRDAGDRVLVAGRPPGSEG